LLGCERQRKHLGVWGPSFHRAGGTLDDSRRYVSDGFAGLTLLEQGLELLLHERPRLAAPFFEIAEISATHLETLSHLILREPQ
jgi:hypothetical protein